MKRIASILAVTALGLNLATAPAAAEMTDTEKGLAALAILGIAALAHHKQHYSGSYRPSDGVATAEFERGYRDGVHGYAYNTFNSTRDYAEGYQAGDRERHNSMAHRQAPSGPRPSTAAVSGCARIVGQNFAVSTRDVHIVKWRPEVNDTWEIETTVGHQHMVCRMSSSGAVVDVRGGGM